MFFVDRFAKSGTLDAPHAAWGGNYSIRWKEGRTEIRNEPARFLVRTMSRRHSRCDILAYYATQCRVRITAIGGMVWRNWVEIHAVSRFLGYRVLARKMLLWV